MPEHVGPHVQSHMKQIYLTLAGNVAERWGKWIRGGGAKRSEAGWRERQGERRSSEGSSSGYVQPLMLTGSHVKSYEVKWRWFLSSSLGHNKVKLIIQGCGGPECAMHLFMDTDSHMEAHKPTGIRKWSAFLFVFAFYLFIFLQCLWNMVL